MGQYNEREESAKNTATEIANGVDQSKAASDSRLDVNRLFSQRYHYSQPSQSNTTVSGSGKILFNKWGARVESGGTTGDTAKLHDFGVEINHNFTKVIKRVKFYTNYHNGTSETTTPNDNLEIGALSANTQDASEGAYLDLSAGQYHVESNTASATVPPDGETIMLEIVVDAPADDTIFRQWYDSTSGPTDEVVTPYTPNHLRPGLAFNTSTGNQDWLQVGWSGIWLIP